MSIVIAVAQGRVGMLAVDARHMFYPPGEPPIRRDLGRKLLHWGPADRCFFSATTGRTEPALEVFRRLRDTRAGTLEEGRLCAAGTLQPAEQGRVRVFTLGPNGDAGPAVELWDLVEGETFHQPMHMRADRPNYAITLPKGMSTEQLAGIDASFRVQIEGAQNQVAMVRAVASVVLAAARLTDTVSTTLDLGLWHPRGGVPCRFDATDLLGAGLPGGLPWTQATIEAAHRAYRASMARALEVDLSRVPSELASDFEVASSTFGVRTKVSAVCPGISALKDGEVLFVAGYAFNTASTGASAQNAAERSEVIRDSTGPAVPKVRVIDGKATTVLAASDSAFSGWAFALDVAVDAGVRSIRIEVGSYLAIDDSGPPPWSPASPSSPYSYVVDLTGPTSHQALLTQADGTTTLVVGKQGGTTITLTPYPQAAAAGTAGAALEIALPNTLSTSGTGTGVAVQDEDAAGDPQGVLGADRIRIGAGLKVDTAGGRPRLNLDVPVLTALSGSIDKANDLVPIWDQSAGAHRKVAAGELMPRKYTVSTSDPTGTPEDGELWYKVDP